MIFEALTLPIVRVLALETRSALATKALEFLTLIRPGTDNGKLAIRVFGLNFPNPIGVAAGLDRNAEVASALLRMGFGFVEVGTVTPREQALHLRRKGFCIVGDQALIHPSEFSNDGSSAVLQRLVERAGSGGIVGVNIGANRDSSDRSTDYLHLIEKLAPVASYITVNLSSPNTPGLRDLQHGLVLDNLLARIVAARNRVMPQAGPTPVLLKIAPDLSLIDLDDVVGIARARHIDGIIVANTTISRPATLRDSEAGAQAGGLSGRPLFALSTRMLAETYVRVEGAFPLIGVGGIDSGEAALAKIKAGADLVQLYSGLVYRGLGLLAEIKTALLRALEHENVDRLSELVGMDAAAATAEKWPD